MTASGSGLSGRTRPGRRIAVIVFIGSMLALVAASLVAEVDPAGAPMETDGSAAATQPIGAAPLPPALDGLPLGEALYGPGAVAAVTRLHGKTFALESGAYGIYGDDDGMVMIWASGTSDDRAAEEMQTEMERAIAVGDSPFQPLGTRMVYERAIHALTGEGQQHFYFRSGALLVWLAVDEDIAERALSDVLGFYP